MEKALDQLELELITDLFLEVLGRLNFEENIAFRFFMCAGRQENYSQEPCACNEMIEIRHEEEDKGQVQSEINAFNLLDALCECSLVKDADVLFKTVKNKVKPGANAYNVLFFRWCKVRNPAREMKVLKEMIQLGLPTGSFTCITSIVTLCRAGAVTKAADLFVFMSTKDSIMSSLAAKT
ncbi:hypothetical protein SADUNF_Sadunf08G0115700 [Salix dunnii]|uniref:Pentatricopeptide repeat-containing protein n=1 Tax=Salix dunnii TaxID=1413687 RepID=A0A835K064_9ROSI|nr:hypothetical protein SADUNF_Sadunf08G0115700 [Salix dunnii]